MSLFGQIGRGLLTGLMTGSAAGGLTAFSTNSLLAGFGVGMLDNMSGRSLSYGLSYGMNNMWNNQYSYGGFYGNNYNAMNYNAFSLYNNYGNDGLGW